MNISTWDGSKVQESSQIQVLNKEREQAQIIATTIVPAVEDSPKPKEEGKGEQLNLSV